MLDVSAVDGGSVLHLVGELDVQSEAQLRAMLAREVGPPGGPGGDIVLDLGGVTFIDSSGLNAILGVCGELPPGCNLRLRNAGRNVRRLVEVTGVLALGNLVLERDGAPADGP